MGDPVLHALPGREVSGYRILRKLGEGGMGAVFEAEQVRLRRAVALKVLPPALSRDKELIVRFEREAHALARVSSPYIVQVYDLGTLEGGLYFIAMEYCAGGSVASRLKKGSPFAEADAARICREAALGLAAAGRLGVIHRDIKPDNLLLGADGEVKVCDFGLAKAASEAAGALTRSGSFMGTPQYMPPEQWQDVRKCDHRTDLYALGCTLYEMLTGKIPFAGPEPFNYGFQHVHDPPPDPRAARPDLGEGMARVVARLLEKDPAKRFQTGYELAAALDALHPPASPTAIPLAPSLEAAGAVETTPPRPAEGAPPPAGDAAPAWPETEHGAPFRATERDAPQEATALRAPAGGEAKPAALQRRLLPAAIALGGLLSAGLAGMLWLGPRAGSDVGWRGEPMPVGMRRGAKLEEYEWAKDGSVMVYVPAGSFGMGSETGQSDEKPIHEVEVDPFYIDKFEVTWAQWRRSGLPVPEAPSFGIRDDHPVVNVSWEEARRYCEWAGKRLPTEAEWEYAARGPKSPTYPWGEEKPDAGGRYRANRGEREVRDGFEFTAPVGSFPAGAAWCGALDMAGNVWEWCEDWYDGAFYARSPRKDPRNQTTAEARVQRGGSWRREPSLYLRAALRAWDPPAARSDDSGFRPVVRAGAGTSR